MNRLVVVALGAAVLAGCASVGTGNRAVEKSANPVKVGVYVGPGARANGVCHWEMLTTMSPDLAPTFLDAKEIAAGALDGLDLLVMPGGSSFTEFDSLKAVGADEKVRSFIRAGGGYVGTCAGNCIVMNEKRRLQISPYERYSCSGRHGMGLLAMKFNERAEALCGIKPSTRKVRYSGGPILKPGKPVEGASFETVAVYDCDLVCEYGTNTTPIVSMRGCPAAIAGTYGKGRVFAIATHPEYRDDTLDILAGSFRFACGRDVRFVRPQRKPGDVCVAVYAPGMVGVADAKMLERLVTSEGIDLTFVNQKEEIGVGALDHADVVILPYGDETVYKEFSKITKGYLERFLARGGKVLVCGVGATCAPKGATLCASRDDLVDRLLALR